MHGFKAFGLVPSAVGSASGVKIMQVYIAQWPKPTVSSGANRIMKSNAVNQMPYFLLFL